jgi:hypothetical protein
MTPVNEREASLVREALRNAVKYLAPVNDTLRWAERRLNALADSVKVEGDDDAERTIAITVAGVRHEMLGREWLDVLAIATATARPAPTSEQATGGCVLPSDDQARAWLKHVKHVARPGWIARTLKLPIEEVAERLIFRFLDDLRSGHPCLPATAPLPAATSEREQRAVALLREAEEYLMALDKDHESNRGAHRCLPRRPPCLSKQGSGASRSSRSRIIVGCTRSMEVRHIERQPMLYGNGSAREEAPCPLT